MSCPVCNQEKVSKCEDCGQSKCSQCNIPCHTAEIFVKITDQDKLNDLKQVVETMNWEISWSSRHIRHNVLHVLVPKENLLCTQKEMVELLLKYDWVTNADISKLSIAYLC